MLHKVSSFPGLLDIPQPKFSRYEQNNPSRKHIRGGLELEPGADFATYTTALDSDPAVV